MAERSIYLSDGSTRWTLKPPLWGTQSELHLALKIVKCSDGSYSTWDNGIANDFRICKSAKMWLKNSLQEVCNAAIRASGRGEPLQFILGDTPSGFNPWGPDLGDMGTHTANVLSMDAGGIQLDPFRAFESEWSLNLVSAPPYTPPSPSAQGAIQIGSVSGLPYPSSGFSPSANYAYSLQQSQNGKVKILDHGLLTDSWETQFSLECNAGNAAALLTFIQTTSRGSQFSITVPNYTYMGGADNQSGGTFLARLTNNIIPIQHVATNRFQIDLSLWVKAA